MVIIFISFAKNRKIIGFYWNFLLIKPFVHDFHVTTASKIKSKHQNDHLCIYPGEAQDIESVTGGTFWELALNFYNQASFV